MSHPARPPAARLCPDDDHRLIVAEDRLLPGAFVYQIVDWRTGEVIDELPRSDLIGLRDSPDYKAGALINRKA